MEHLFVVGISLSLVLYTTIYRKLLPTQRMWQIQFSLSKFTKYYPIIWAQKFSLLSKMLEYSLFDAVSDKNLL